MSSTGKPLISVVIDTYNYGIFIEKAIGSVLGQSLPADMFEVIVVDDGSTDDTAERLEKYKGRIVYVRKQNGGQASALNAGIERARGEAVAFLDADDYWYPKKLESIAPFFEKNGPIDLVYHYMDIVDADGKITGELKDSRGDVPFSIRPMERVLAGEIPFASETSGITVRASALRTIMPLPEEMRICADWYVNFLLPLYVRECAMITSVLGAYRIHGANLWKNRALSASHVEAALVVLRAASRAMESSGKKLGYDISKCLGRMRPIIEEQDIVLRKLKGDHPGALAAAALWQAAPQAGLRGIFERSMKKMHLILYAALPLGAYRWLYARYEKSALFRIKR